MSNTPENAATSPELVQLINGYCDGTLSAAEGERLETLLRGNRQAQRVFLVYLAMHARMSWDASALSGAAEPSGATRYGSTPRASLLSRRALSALAALAASLAIVAMSVWIWRDANRRVVAIDSPHLPPIVAVQAPIATVTQATGRWNDHARPARIGEKFSASVVDLAQGFVELTFTNGAVVLLEAPTRLEIVDEKRTFLHFGRVVAKVDERSAGFVIDTQGASLLDLGTEFGAAVDGSGVTQVQVFDGAIDATAKDRAGKPKRVERLVAGDARKLDANEESQWELVDFRPESFVRTFPVVTDARQGPKTPYNKSRYEAIHVAAVSTPPTIDGDLGEWDRSRAFQSACVEPYGESYSVLGLMAYDSEQLYLAAHVADPSPMVNQVDAISDPAFFWAGGSVSVRLAASGEFKWPLDALAPTLATRALPDAGRRPQDLDERVVHIGMWYSQPLAQSQIRFDYGIGSHRKLLNPADWQGAFRRDEDGRGYTLEYAIPWSLLNTTAPQPGDVWPASWNVHWSDEHGRTCMGRLVEITNPTEEYLFIRGSSWGKAIFDAPN